MEIIRHKEMEPGTIRASLRAEFVPLMKPSEIRSTLRMTTSTILPASISLVSAEDHAAEAGPETPVSKNTAEIPENLDRTKPSHSLICARMAFGLWTAEKAHTATAGATPLLSVVVLKGLMTFRTAVGYVAPTLHLVHHCCRPVRTRHRRIPSRQERGCSRARRAFGPQAALIE
jgi:hypothetical protein